MAPLALPPADERTFASLVADARARIPRLAPAWTDHNAHDPGITLVELLAYLTEADLYRLARVTAAERRAFLRWFALESRGPTVAETVVALQQPAAALASPPAAPASPLAAPASVAVTADLELRAATGALAFSTTAPVTVQAARIVGLFTGGRRLRGSDRAGVAAVLDGPAAALGPLGQDPFVIALDQPVAGEVDLYVWTGAPDHDDEARRRVKDDAAERARARAAAGRPCPASRLDDWTRHYEVDVAWEIFTAAGWVAVVPIADETRALSMSGFVRLRVDAALAAGGVAAAPAAYAIQVRAAGGTYEAPPQLQAVLLNAAPARHQSRTFGVRVGSSDGRAGQSLRVPMNPAVPSPGAPLVFDRTEVAVTAAGGTPRAWTVAAEWDRAGPDAPVVVLDPDAATLDFGDGDAGRVPPAGAAIDLFSRVGGGAGGNVPAGTLTRAPAVPPASPASPIAAGGDLVVVQPFPGRGGGPAPEIPDLQARALAELAHPTRATTIADIETLVRDTPGVRVGRVRVVPGFHPDFPGFPAPGCVTVVVIPDGVGPAPAPTPGFLAAVRAYLGPRRPVTTEVHVVGPTYLKVAVRARLNLTPSADAAAAVTAASASLDAFFHPLTGGADGGGWPVGRDAYRSEVLALLQAIDGVHHVDQLELLVGPDRAPTCDNAAVCPTDLIDAGPHELTIAPARIS
jgi:predicted phage baseplate assembly protein